MGIGNINKILKLDIWFKEQVHVNKSPEATTKKTKWSLRNLTTVSISDQTKISYWHAEVQYWIFPWYFFSDTVYNDYTIIRFSGKREILLSSQEVVWDWQKCSLSYTNFIHTEASKGLVCVYSCQCAWCE